MKDIESIFKKILDCSFEVHTALGPGLLESVYEECLYFELIQSGLKVEKQKPLPVLYKDVKLDVGYKLDLFVEDTIIVEIKAVQEMNDIYLAQILTYMKLTHCKLGLLINFNVRQLKNGIKRVVL
jgi:GxxExxY protein